MHLLARVAPFSLVLSLLIGGIFGNGPSEAPVVRSAISWPHPAGEDFSVTGAAVQALKNQADAELARQQAEIDQLAAEEAERLRVEQARINAPIYRSPAGCGYEALIRVTWPPSQGDKAVAVAMRESGCTNTARNPSGASGLFQLMLPMHTQIFEAVGCSADQWADAECNVRAAYALWLGSGWGPWGG